MPGTVSEVSATLVASTMRRPLPGSKTGPARPATGARTAAGSRRCGAAALACCCARCLRRWSAASRISRSPGRKTRMSPGRFAPQLVDRVGDGVVEVEVLALLERPPALFDREQAARDLDHRRRPVARGEVLREAVGVDRGRGDDDLQVGPPRQDLAQVAEQEVDVQAALVRLVDDQRVVGAGAAGRSASRPAGCRRSSA